jgi:hypothetical protein
LRPCSNSAADSETAHLSQQLLWLSRWCPRLVSRKSWVRIPRDASPTAVRRHATLAKSLCGGVGIVCVPAASGVDLEMLGHRMPGCAIFCFDFLPRNAAYPRRQRRQPLPLCKTGRSGFGPMQWRRLQHSKLCFPLAVASEHALPSSLPIRYVMEFNPALCFVGALRNGHCES